MSIVEYIDNKRKIQKALLDFIDCDEITDEINHKLRDLLTDPQLLTNVDEFEQLIFFIANIAENHHRNANFYTRMDKIFQIFKDELKQTFSNFDIFCFFFKHNKTIIIHLITANIITLDEEIKDIMTDMSDYFSPEIHNGEIDQQLLSRFESTEKYYDLRSKGENENYICQLIRDDSVEEFIKYVNQNNISLYSKIPQSIFETNRFLLENSTELIEYAAFFGSIQIFKYLISNNVELKSSLWLYAIHSNNAEMIQILDEKKVEPSDFSFRQCYEESLKCYHNEIALYIKENFLDKSIHNQTICALASPIKCQNYEFFSNNADELNSLIFYFYKYGYSTIIPLIKKDNYFINDPENFVKDRKYRETFQDWYIISYKEKKYLLKTFKSCVGEDWPCIDEFETLKRCKYPSIIKLIGYSPIDIEGEFHPTILTDYYKNTLGNYTHNKTTDYIIILGIAIAMNYLHKNGIVHNILCPGSIFIDENYYPIISNVEISKYLLRQHTPSNDFVISYYHDLCYTDPKVFEAPKTFESNVFSYSIIVSYILLGTIPYTKDYGHRFKTSTELKNAISSGLHPNFGQINNKVIVDFLESCIGNQRPTFNQILDIITKEEFYSYFEPLDHDAVKKYLDIYGDEFNELKGKF